MIIKNKHGAEKILSIYWFAILIIVAGAVVAMVSLFYGTPYDVRDAEANIMINKVVNCLSEKGKLNQELFNENKDFNENFNLKEKCNLVFETELKSEREEYFLQADFYDLNNGPEGVSPGVKVFSISDGNFNLYTDCKIAQGEKEYKKLAKCVDRDFYSLDDSDNFYKINVLSAVRKTEKNVK
ncbi:MAG: hypothetical protein AABY06_02330 [Nanoarchaeota archaeon]